MAHKKVEESSDGYHPVVRARAIPTLTRLVLYVQAGGRCEFDGCNEYLLEHYPTESVGNFGEQAHIFAFNEGGPRGKEPGRPDEINQLSNLILLCKACHHLIDNSPDAYPVGVLRKFKRDHEDRVHSLTGLSKDRDTSPLVLKALVGGRPVDVSDEEMQVAVAPNYLKRRDKLEIDLTAIPDTAGAAYWQTAIASMDRMIPRLYDVPVRAGRTLRVSVFAIAPIPLLVYLGSKLSDKIEVLLFQRHRNPESWAWNVGPGNAAYETHCIRFGSDPNSVCLLVNLSGSNGLDTLPKSLPNTLSVYELRLKSETPNPLFLKCRGDLDKFHDEWVRAMAGIRRAHPGVQLVHLFPAIPAPVAITIGRSRLSKVDPAMQVYDHDKRAGGFVPTLEIK